MVAGPLLLLLFSGSLGTWDCVLRPVAGALRRISASVDPSDPDFCSGRPSATGFPQCEQTGTWFTLASSRLAFSSVQVSPLADGVPESLLVGGGRVFQKAPLISHPARGLDQKHRHWFIPPNAGQTGSFRDELQLYREISHAGTGRLLATGPRKTKAEGGTEELPPHPSRWLFSIPLIVPCLSHQLGFLEPPGLSQCLGTWLSFSPRSPPPSVPAPSSRSSTLPVGVLPMVPQERSHSLQTCVAPKHLPGQNLGKLAHLQRRRLCP